MYHSCPTLISLSMLQNVKVIACLKSVFGYGLELDDIVSIINSSLPVNSTRNDLYNAINDEFPPLLYAVLDCAAVLCI